MSSPRRIRHDAATNRKHRNQCHCIIGAFWYGGWALILWSLTMLLFVAQVLAERLIFIGLIALGFVMLFYSVSWALIVGTSFE